MQEFYHMKITRVSGCSAHAKMREGRLLERIMIYDGEMPGWSIFRKEQGGEVFAWKMSP